MKKLIAHVNGVLHSIRGVVTLRSAASPLLFLLLMALPLQDATANILFNGDFEYGFAGWSYGAWWGGEYEFSIVDDSYTGDYAARMDCITVGTEPKCLLNTNYPAIEGKTYTLSFRHKASIEGLSGLAYMSGNGVDVYHLFSSGTEWKQEVLTFEAPSTYPILSFYHYDSTEGTSLLIDHIIINEGDTAIDEHADFEAYDGVPTKATVGDYVTLIDGCPFFPISAYNVPNPQEAADAGFNCLIDISSSIDYTVMDEAHQLGLPVIVGGMTGMLRSHLPRKAGQYARLYMNHPATFAHYMIDEPDHDWWYVPPNEVAQASQSIHEADPFHPTMMLQMRWSIGATWMGKDYYNYSEASDIFACDPYVFNDGGGVAQLGTTMTKIRAQAGNTGKPVWFAIEGGWGENQVLSREEQYGTTWTSIANNVSGLFFFEYDFLKNHAEQYRAALDITAEVRHLEGALTSPVSTMPKRTNGIDWYSRQSPGGLAIFAANTTSAAKDGVKIEHPEIAAGSTVTDVFDRREIIPSEGSITDSFGPYERHVYIIDAAPHFCLAYPGDGATDINPAAKITIMAIDDRDGIDQGSVTMTVNGETVIPEITEDSYGGVRIAHDPGGYLTGTVSVKVTAKSSAGESITHEWSFGFAAATGVMEGSWEDSTPAPRYIVLRQNYPNPCNPSTTIRYTLFEPGDVTLTIHNLVGQEILTLVDEYQEASEHAVEWDAGGFSNGVYLYTLRAGKHSETKKLTVQK